MEFCDIPLTGSVCDAADLATDPGGAVGDWAARSAGELAVAAVDLVTSSVNDTTKVDLNAAWFRDNYAAILPIGLVLLVATCIAQLVRASFRRDGQALTRAVTGTVTGALFAFVAVPVTAIAVDVIDALSDGLLAVADTTIPEAVRRITKVAQLGSIAGLGWLVPTLGGAGSALSVFLYWGVMVARKVGVLALVTLAPIAGAGGGWEPTRRARRGWIVATASLVGAKLLMTVLFLLGLAAVGDSQPTTDSRALADVIAGAVIMLLVALSPYATWRFVHWAADTSGEQLHGAAAAGAQAVRQYGERAGRRGAAAVMQARAGSAPAAPPQGAPPQGPPSVPGQKPQPDASSSSTTKSAAEDGAPPAQPSGSDASGTRWAQPAPSPSAARSPQSPTTKPSPPSAS